MKPSVSIIVPYYNEIDYFEETLKSIKNQTFYDWELILVVDSEDKKMKDFVTVLTKGDDRIRLIFNSKNLGITKSLNNGLKIAKGDFIARLDADDVAHKDRLYEQHKYLLEHPEIGVIGSWGIIIDSSGKHIGKIVRAITNKEITKKLLFQNQFIHSSVMFRKSLVTKYGVYDENFLRSQDYEFWLRLRKKTKFYNLNKPLIYYRSHSGSITQTKNIEQRVLGIKMMYNYYKKEHHDFSKLEKCRVFLFFMKQFYKIILNCFFK